MVSITIDMGDAFLLDTPPNKQHLYIAIAPISESDYLFVSVTTRRPNSEATCVLMPGSDVPSFIVRESVIVYKRARSISAEKLAELITRGSRIPKGSCSSAVLARIQQGGLISIRLENKYKNALKAFLDTM